MKLKKITTWIENLYHDSEFDEEIEQSEQAFDIVTVSSFVSLFLGNIIEPLYFVKVIEEGVTVEDLFDPYGHFVSKIFTESQVDQKVWICYHNCYYTRQSLWYLHCNQWKFTIGNKCLQYTY